MASENTHGIGAGKIPRGTTITKEIDDALKANAKASNLSLTSYVRALMHQAAKKKTVFKSEQIIISELSEEEMVKVGDALASHEVGKLSIGQHADEKGNPVARVKRNQSARSKPRGQKV